MPIFYQQLLASFCLGGLFVGLQSWAAEKAPKKLAGIVVSLPSTIIVNFFFLGLILSPQEFKAILPVVPAPLGFSFILIVAYIYSAKIICAWLGGTSNSKPKKLLLIAICSIGASITWLVFSLPFAYFGFDNLWLSLLIYFIFIAFAQWVLSRPREVKPIKTIHYSVSQIIGRACFAGTMVSAAVFLGKTLGPLWGGVVAMFPSAYLSALVILHYYHEHDKLFDVFANAAIGSMSLIVYALVSHFCFDTLGLWLGTLVSILASLVFSYTLSRLTK